jgi:hypothetical protein
MKSRTVEFATRCRDNELLGDTILSWETSREETLGGGKIILKCIF